MFDQIEKLKTDLTDKYVLVDATIPELARFEGHVGQVKTVNMNGRALVQFDTWNNIGWYDIDVDCLRVVPKPDPAAVAAKQETKKAAPAAKPAAAADAPAGAKKLSPLEMARMQGAAKSGGAAPAKAAAPAKDKPAAPAAGAKKSVADILAAARANKPGAGAAAEATAAAPAEAPPEVEAVAEKVAPAAAKPAGKKSTLTPGHRPGVAEILAWCREHDAK